MSRMETVCCFWAIKPPGAFSDLLNTLGGQQILFCKNVVCARGWAEVDGELRHVGAEARDHFSAG